MWSAASERFDAFIGASQSGLSFAGQALYWWETESFAQGWERILEHLRRESSGRLGFLRLRRRLAMRVWLSGCLARPFVLEAVSQLRGADEAQTLALALCGERTGLKGPHSVWIDQGNLESSWLAVGVDKLIVSALLTTSQQVGVAVVSIRPWWNAALNASIERGRPLALLGIDDGESFTVLGGTRQNYTAATSYDITQGSQREQLWSRALLAMNPEDGGAMQVLRLASTNVAVSGELSLEVPFGARLRAET